MEGWGLYRTERVMDITEAEVILKRWQVFIELCKKGLKDHDNHNGVVTYLESDILECEVKWVLGSISMNKASESDLILAELFKIIKDNSVKCYTQYFSIFGKLSSGFRNGKCQFSF